jgi:predicted metal-dependent phosphoesterase TrpH
MKQDSGKIDLHIHTKTGSDGALPVEEVFLEAKKRHIALMSITEHDCLDSQEKAISLARELDICYLTGIELNVTFHHPEYDKSISLDFLGYGFDIYDPELKSKLRVIKEHREKRARQILDNLNAEFIREGLATFTEEDMKKIEESVDGVFGRPHIASYLVKKGIVRTIQEAFDKYLVKCDAPKYLLTLPEASRLIRNAGGLLVHAHPNDPNGTSLASVTQDLTQQTQIIEQYMLEYIDGVECWHSRHDEKTTRHYLRFAQQHHKIVTGGSDCHQRPLILGTLDIPQWVAEQFRSKIYSACVLK